MALARTASGVLLITCCAVIKLCGHHATIEHSFVYGTPCLLSSLAVALSLPADGVLVALDRDEAALALARRYWEAAGVAHKVSDEIL